MTTGIQELKQAARMQEWSARIIECRSSGKNVRAWCKEQGIASQTYYRWEKRFIAEAAQRLSLPAPAKGGVLMRVNPDHLPEGISNAAIPEMTIRHGESVITLPAGSSVEAISYLVKALNRHA